MRYACEVTREQTKIATGSLTIVCATRQGDEMKAVSFPPEIAAQFQVATEPGRQASTAHAGHWPRHGRA